MISPIFQEPTRLALSPGEVNTAMFTPTSLPFSNSHQNDIDIAGDRKPHIPASPPLRVLNNSSHPPVIPRPTVSDPHQPSSEAPKETRFTARTVHGDRQCTNCGEMDTPQWRGTLCNACSLWKRSRGTERPLPLVFPPRKRVRSPSMDEIEVERHHEGNRAPRPTGPTGCTLCPATLVVSKDPFGRPVCARCFDGVTHHLEEKQRAIKQARYRYSSPSEQYRPPSPQLSAPVLMPPRSEMPARIAALSGRNPALIPGVFSNTNKPIHLRSLSTTSVPKSHDPESRERSSSLSILSETATTEPRVLSAAAAYLSRMPPVAHSSLPPPRDGTGYGPFIPDTKTTSSITSNHTMSKEEFMRGAEWLWDMMEHTSGLVHALESTGGRNRGEGNMDH